MEFTQRERGTKIGGIFFCQICTFLKKRSRSDKGIIELNYVRNNIWWIHFVEIPSSPEESSGWWHWAPPASSWWTTPSSQRRTCWGRRLYRDLSEIYYNISYILYIFYLLYVYIYILIYIKPQFNCFKQFSWLCKEICNYNFCTRLYD